MRQAKQMCEHDQGRGISIELFGQGSKSAQGKERKKKKKNGVSLLEIALCTKSAYVQDRISSWHAFNPEIMPAC